MKTIFTQPQNENEIKTSLNLFKKLLTKHADRFTIEHADPIKENCYIASAGCVVGVYFPNSIIKDSKHTLYKVCCLAKINNILGVVYELKEDNNLTEKAKIYFDNYIFYSFNDLIYTYEETLIIKNINNRIKDYEKQLNALNKIKRVYKKNGDNFARLFDNFEGATFTPSYSLMSGALVSVKINYDCVYLYRKDENKDKDPTADEIETLINEAKEKYNNYLKEERDNLRNLEKNYKKFSKIVKDLKAFLNSVNNQYDFKKALEYML